MSAHKETTTTTSGGTSTQSGPTSESHGSTQDTLIGEAKQSSQNDIVGFISDGAVQTAEHHRPEALDSLLNLMRAPEDQPHSIQSYLARPIRIADIELKATDSPGGILAIWNIMGVLATAPCFEAARRKLQGFFGFTAKAHLKIVVNAQPFESGIYSINFAPLRLNNENDQFWPMIATLSSEEYRLPFCSGLPSKLINIANHSEGELAVGYIGPNMFLNLVDGTGDFGDFFLQCVVPLAAGSNGANANLAVYLYFTELKLFGAAKSYAQGPADTFGTSVPSERSEAKGTGETKISDLADKLSSVPLLAELQPEATFALKAGASLARQFGFSKPNALAEHQRMAITPYGQVANIDGTSNAFKLGASTDQNLAVQPMGVTNEDEMSLNYLMRQPNYLKQFEWKKSNNNQDILTSIPCNPNCNLMETNASTRTSYYPSKLFYLAQNFIYWRGSINYTFHVAATKFHSGRLRFTLDLDSVTTPSACDASSLHYGKIVDIRDGMSFTINVPYMATTPWRFVPRNLKSTIEQDWFVSDAAINSGQFIDNCLYVYVENYLRAPDTAASSVKIAVYISAGEDFELSAPSIGNYSFYNRKYTRDAKTTEELFEEQRALGARCVECLPTNRKARAQGPDTPESTDTIPTISLVDNIPQNRRIQLAASSVTMGEKFVSLRQLIKRYQCIGNATNGLDNSVLCILPFEQTASYATGANEFFSKTFLDRTLVLFRFWRGGMRYIIEPAQDGGKALVQYSTLIDAFDYSLNGAQGFGPMCPVYWLYNGSGNNFKLPFLLNHPEITSFPVDFTQQSGVELQFPYYNRYPFCIFRSVPNTPSIADYKAEMFQGHVPSGFAVIGTRDNLSDILVFRAAADDFQCGYALGAPFCEYNCDFVYAHTT